MTKDILAKQVGYLLLQLWEMSEVVESLTKTPTPSPPTPEPPNAPLD